MNFSLTVSSFLFLKYLVDTVIRMSEEGRLIGSRGSVGGSRVPLFRGVGMELSGWIGTIKKNS